MMRVCTPTVLCAISSLNNMYSSVLKSTARQRRDFGYREQWPGGHKGNIYDEVTQLRLGLETFPSRLTK